MDNLSKHRWMMVITLSFIICHLSFSPAGAQTFTQQLQQKPAAGQGSVTIHHSDSVDKLVNTTVLGKTPAPASQAGQAAKNVQPGKTSQNGQVAQSAQESADTLQQATPRATYKTMGYRVQAFSGGNSRADRQQAESIRASIKAQYPRVAVYVHFRSPHWICRVGNYRTYEEAHQMLVSLRNMGYSQAYVVKEKITVAY